MVACETDRGVSETGRGRIPDGITANNSGFAFAALRVENKEPSIAKKFVIGGCARFDGRVIFFFARKRSKSEWRNWQTR